MKKKMLLSALLMGGALLASCGGGGGSDTSSTTPGDITPSSYATIVGQVANSTPQTSAISTQAYQIGDYILRYISAVTIDNGQVIAISDEIDDQGKFQLTLLKDKDYVFTIFDNDGQPVVSTIGKTFQIIDNDFVTIELTDTDNDGTPDSLEVIPTDNDSILVVEDPEVIDNDGDKLPDIVENIDTDNDGIPDIEEYLADKDGDGILDSAEDTDNDGIPDIIQDHDKDGIIDIFEDEDGDGKKDAFEYIHGDNGKNQHGYNEEHGNKGKGKERHGNNNQYMDNDNIQDPIQYVMQLPYEELSEEEKAGILYMREEEKLARDVYAVLMKMYEGQTNTFANIVESEQRHMDMVKALIDKYGLEDPVEQTNDQIGVFVNQELQQLYNDLVERGSQSLEEALKVGALIEEVDIIDLKERLEQEDNQDIRFVYENLMKGSRNHLRAFVRALQKLGIDYQPQMLNEEEFQEIINSDMERGWHSNDREHGNNQGKGERRGQQGKGKWQDNDGNWQGGNRWQDDNHGQGRGKQGNHGQNNERMGQGNSNIERAIEYVMQLPYEELSEEEKAGILYMREEEKLARDVYAVLKEKYANETMTFTNISESEQRHMDMVKALIDKYGLEDPVEQTNDQIGVFVNSFLQEKFNELVERGSQSLEEALKVGALIEELDIIDLEERLEQEDNQDIRFVYENLMKGSRNHLRAFVRAIENLGIDYEPQLLPEDVFESIINSDMERGRFEYVTIGGTLREDVNNINTTALTQKYVAAYMLDTDNILPVLAAVDNDGTFSMKLLRGKEYVFGVFDKDGNPVAFTEGEEYQILGNNAVTMVVTDIDRDNIEELYVDPKDERALIEKKVEYLADKNGNGIPDLLEKDFDKDGVEDFKKAFKDEDHNGIPDAHEDKDRNGIPDVLEHAKRTKEENKDRVNNHNEMQNKEQGKGKENGHGNNGMENDKEQMKEQHENMQDKGNEYGNVEGNKEQNKYNGYGNNNGQGNNQNKDKGTEHGNSAQNNMQENQDRYQDRNQNELKGYNDKQNDRYQNRDMVKEPENMQNHNEMNNEYADQNRDRIRENDQYKNKEQQNYQDYNQGQENRQNNTRENRNGQNYGENQQKQQKQQGNHSQDRNNTNNQSKDRYKNRV